MRFDRLTKEELEALQKQQTDLSPELKQYGYDLFGLSQFDGSDQSAIPQIPLAPQQPTPVERKPAALDVPTPEIQKPIEKIITEQSELQEAQPEQQIEPLKKETSDIQKMIEESDKAEKDIEFQKQLAKTRDAIMGAGLGRQLQGDYSMYEQMAKQTKKPIENYLLKQELEDKKAKNDPNSNVSKLTRKSLEDLGMNMKGLEAVPYSQLEKLYPSLTQALYTKIAADARKEENSIKRSERADAKLEKLDQNKQKELVKHIDYSINNLKKSYGEYSKSQTTLDSISNILGAAKNKITPGTADVTMLYSFISSLDPASTVREGEIQLSKSAMSLWGRIKQGSAQLTGGDLLDVDTRKSIEEIMKAVQAAREKQFAKQKANMIEAGVGKGLDKDMLNAYIYPEIDASSALKSAKNQGTSVKQETITLPKAYQPGHIVTLKNGEQYIVQEDGVTGVKK